MDDESMIVDDRLRLIFTCCHPALELPARVALTLRALGGLSTGEIARAFLVAEPTMGKRIVRAKRKIAHAHIPYRVPDDEELPDRLRGVLRVVYLIFNEGYAAAEGDRLVREELCDEALRLGELLCRLMPDDAEVWGLLALMLLHDARRAARVDPSGRYVALEDQDRSLWDQDRIAKGARRSTARCASGVRASTSCRPRSRRCSSPTHRLGADRRALRRARRPQSVAGDRAQPRSRRRHGRRTRRRAWSCSSRCSEELDRYQPLHAAHAELLSRAGDAEGAARAYERAIELSANAVERTELERRLKKVSKSPLGGCDVLA